MATLTKDTPRKFESGHDDRFNELPIVASDIIYAGAAVGELNDTGTYQPLGTGSTVDKFAGFCVEKCDNSSGAAGDKQVKVRQSGRVVLSVTGVTAVTDVEKTVWATDDNAFTLTYAAGAVEIGRIAKHISGTNCVVEFRAFNLRQAVEAHFFGQTTEAATDRVFFLATRPYYIQAIDQIHSVAAGGTSTLQVVKDTSTNAPGAGTDLLTTAFDLNATANTVQNGAIATTAGLRKLNAGDRLALDFANAIQSSAGISVSARLIPL